MQRVLVVPGNVLKVQDAKKSLQTRMHLLAPGNLMILVGLLALLGVPGALLGAPETLLGLLATVIQLATAAPLMLEVRVGGAYVPGNGCLGAV